MVKWKHQLYGTWAIMIVRCAVPGARAYPAYGGRGIKVCDRWLNSFDDFISDMGERPAGHSLDRIDVNGNYEPTNCRWATRSTQQRNTRRARFATVDGVRYHLSELSEKYGISARTLSYRIAQNWPAEKLLSKKPQYSNGESQKKAVAAHAAMRRAQPLCKRGHKLSGKNLYTAPNGSRVCRTCKAAIDRFLYHGKKGCIEDYL